MQYKAFSTPSWRGYFFVHGRESCPVAAQVFSPRHILFHTHDKMKRISLFLLMAAFLCNCKKESQNRVITITTSNITATTYNITIYDNTKGSILSDVRNGNTNTSFTATATQGDQIKVDYTFVTTGQQYGQGNLDITCNSQSLLHANGGTGSNFLINIP